MNVPSNSAYRKGAILAAATEHFARFGFEGASLRKIAADAQVSLTLLSHHFGTKMALLATVVDMQERFVKQRAAPLLDTPQREETAAVLAAWIRVELDLSATSAGLRSMQLLRRIGWDADSDAARLARHVLEPIHQAFIEAIKLRHERIGKLDAEACWQLAHGALDMLGETQQTALWNAGSRARAEHHAVAFIVNGMEATLYPDQDASPETGVPHADGHHADHHLGVLRPVVVATEAGCIGDAAPITAFGDAPKLSRSGARRVDTWP